MRRRPFVGVLLALGALPLAAQSASVQRGRALQFPRDHGSHPDARIEWWYATGWLAAPGEAEPRYGFQLTFFRSRTDIAPNHPSRFAATQLVFAHTALTDLAAKRARHDQRIARALAVAQFDQRARLQLQQLTIARLFAQRGGDMVARRHIVMRRKGLLRPARWIARSLIAGRKQSQHGRQEKTVPHLAETIAAPVNIPFPLFKSRPQLTKFSVGTAYKSACAERALTIKLGGNTLLARGLLCWLSTKSNF